MNVEFTEIKKEQKNIIWDIFIYKKTSLVTIKEDRDAKARISVFFF